jgi:hypothetical protein
MNIDNTFIQQMSITFHDNKENKYFDFIKEGIGGVMLASRGEKAVAVPFEKIVKKVKLVPPDHFWIKSARNVGTCFGD